MGAGGSDGSGGVRRGCSSGPGGSVSGGGLRHGGAGNSAAAGRVGGSSQSCGGGAAGGGNGGAGRVGGRGGIASRGRNGEAGSSRYGWRRGGARRGRGAAVAPPEEFEVDGIPVTLTRKRVKNLNRRVRDADGSVAVSAPPHASREVVAAFVRDRRAWIERTRRALAASPRGRAAAAAPDEVREWRAVVEACVPALIEAWEPIMGVKAGKVAYRNMTSRWGSCQPATSPCASRSTRRSAWNTWWSTSCATCSNAATAPASNASWTPSCPTGATAARSCGRRFPHASLPPPSSLRLRVRQP